MIRYQNECVGCPAEIGCLGSSCLYYNVMHYYCDKCGEQDVTLYHYDGMELCADCVLKELEVVEGSGW